MNRLMFAMLVVFALVVPASAQEKNVERVRDLVGKFPVPAKKDGKLAEVDKVATDATLAELLKDVDGSVAGLVGLLAVKDADSQARHTLHALVMKVGEGKETTARQATAKALAATLGQAKSKDIQGFVIRQLHLIGDEKQAPAIGKFLLDGEIGDSAAQALLAIRSGAGEQFRQALSKAEGKQRAQLVQGLGTLKEKAAAEELRKLLDDKDSDLRLLVAWALANVADAGAAERMLKLADDAKGYERNNLTDSCLLLAENLVAGGDKKSARQIYTHLHETRTDKAERFLKEAAARGLAATR